MNKNIIALSAGAASVVTAVTMAFGGAVPATAAEVPASSLTASVCAALPAQVTDLTNQITGMVTGITSNDTDLTAKKAALTTSITDLAAASVAYIQTVNNGGNVVAAGQALLAKSSVFADKVVAENNAMNASFDAQRNAFLSGQSKSFVDGINNGLCGIAVPVPITLPALPLL